MAGENQTVKKTNRRGPVRRLLAPSAALAGLVAVPAALAAPAFAEEPEELKSTVTDTAGVISDEKALRDTLASTRDKTHKSVYIVFVKNFGSKTNDTWAKEAFRKSGLSRSDSVIAVATELNRFSLFAGGTGYSVAELRNALDGSGVYDKWRSGDWAGGAKSVASNLEENAAKKEKANSKGAGESKGSGLSGGAAALLIGVPAVGAGAAGGVYVWRRRKKGKELEAKNADDLASLSKRAARQLLETDDGVRGAAAELEFARAEFGVEATKQFAEALAFAQDSLQKAFVVRQALDDDIPETPQQQWEMNQRILALTASAREAITAQEQGFQNLRNLSARVDQHLAELQTRADELDGQRNILMAEIDNLALTYSPAALATLRTYPDQIATLVTSARSSIASGRHNASEGKRNEAVAFARMAEETLGHAAAKAEEVKKARGSLDDAFQKVHAALASISSDVVDAKRLGAGNPVIAAKQADAEKAIAAHSSGDVDPIKALSELAAAEDALDAALVDVRNADEIRKRKEEASQRNRGIAQQTIDRVERVEGYSRYADQKARTLLATARENIAKGDSAQSPDARDDYYKAAVSAADRAEDRVIDLRERDSRRYDYGSYDYNSRGGSGIGHTMGGMLAGMVLGSLFNSGHDDRHRGGFSTGSFFGGDSDDDGGFSLGSLFDGDSDGGGFDFDFDFGDSDGGSF